MNNNYLARHRQSLQSANLLRDNKNNLHSNSIHCSYYSVYQMIMYVIKVNRYNIGAERNHWVTEGSHEKTLNFVFQKMIQVDKKRAFLWITKVQNLKAHRHSADYRESHQDAAISGVCYDSAVNLSEILTEIFLER